MCMRVRNMNRTVLALVGVTVAASLQRCAAEVAMLSEVRGTVQVYQVGKDKWVKGTLMLLLAKGDKVKTGANSTAGVVFLSSGAREQLLAECVALVDSAGCKVETGPAKKALPNLKSAVTNKLSTSRVAGGRSGGVLLRASEDAKSVILGSLFDTKTRAARPVFRWCPTEGADEYVVRLLDEDDKVVWEGKTKETSITYPDAAPALQPGVDYSWQVEARTEGKRQATGSGGFSLLAEDEGKAVQAALEELSQAAVGEADPTVVILRAALLSEHELWDEVLECYFKLAELFPDDPTIHTKLASLLERQGRARESKEHAEKAKALAAKIEG